METEVLHFWPYSYFLSMALTNSISLKKLTLNKDNNVIKNIYLSNILRFSIGISSPVRQYNAFKFT